jgi:ketol-acid reductoisomerase
MVSGYNHNFLYKGVIFHIQTEDSGVSKALITTLLYRDGIIIASKKTDYSDIIMVEMLEKVVEDLMKEQHKDMLRRLKAGEFDSRAFSDTAEASRPLEESEKAPSSHQDHSIAPLQAHLAEKSPLSDKSLDEIILEYLASEED